MPPKEARNVRCLAILAGFDLHGHYGVKVFCVQLAGTFQILYQTRM